MKKIFLYLLLILIIQSCDILNPAPETKVVRDNGKIFIVDRTDKRWDITHASEQYNFKAEDFQYGLGPYAILPINNPEMWNPGDYGYPLNNQDIPIIGASLYTHTRAYPLSILSRHEVVNEWYGPKPLAVGY